MSNRLFLTSGGSHRTNTSHFPKLIHSVRKHHMRDDESYRTNKDKTEIEHLQSLSIGADKLEVVKLDEWNTRLDSHYKELESEFNRLYKTIESENAIHSKLMERMQGSKDVRRPATNSTSKRTDDKTQTSSSRQAKEFEERLQNQYTELDHKIAEMKETVKLESTRVCDLRAELHELHSQRAQINAVFDQEESMIKGLRLQNLASFLAKKNAIASRKSVTEANYSKIARALQLQAEQALELVEAKRVEIESCKDKIRAIRIALVKHFSQILKEGKDCRAEGLRWVVAELAKYSVKVTEAFFPDYLDSQSVQVIMTLTEKAREVEELNEFLHNQYRGARNSQTNSGRGQLNDIRKRLKRVRSDIITKQKTIVRHDSRTRKVQILREVVKDSEYADYHGVNKARSDWNRIQSAEERLESMRAQIEEIQLSEVRRLAHDYFLANPRMDRHLLVSAIVGTESVDRYLNLLKKDEQQAQSLLEKIKTFSFTKT